MNRKFLVLVHWAIAIISICTRAPNADGASITNAASPPADNYIYGLSYDNPALPPVEIPSEESSAAIAGIKNDTPPDEVLERNERISDSGDLVHYSELVETSENQGDTSMLKEEDETDTISENNEEAWSNTSVYQLLLDSGLIQQQKQVEGAMEGEMEEEEDGQIEIDGDVMMIIPQYSSDRALSGGLGLLLVSHSEEQTIAAQSLDELSDVFIDMGLCMKIYLVTAMVNESVSSTNVDSFPETRPLNSSDVLLTVLQCQNAFNTWRLAMNQISTSSVDDFSFSENESNENMDIPNNLKLPQASRNDIEASPVLDKGNALTTWLPMNQLFTSSVDNFSFFQNEPNDNMDIPNILKLPQASPNDLEATPVLDVGAVEVTNFQYHVTLPLEMEPYSVDTIPNVDVLGQNLPESNIISETGESGSASKDEDVAADKEKQPATDLLPDNKEADLSSDSLTSGDDKEEQKPKYSVNPFYIFPLLTISFIISCIGGTIYNKYMGRTVDKNRAIWKVPRMAVFSDVPNIGVYNAAMKAKYKDEQQKATKMVV